MAHQVLREGDRALDIGLVHFASHFGVAKLELGSRSPRPQVDVDATRELLTTNKGIRDWPEILAGDEILATAILDRLLHRSHVLNIRGRSYRLRDLEDAAERSR